jgi:leader peptidase (prepilin peptidase)/N-methyltransferase
MATILLDGGARQGHDPLLMDELIFDSRLFLVLCAPFMGSFLGVVVTRDGASRSAMTGRSMCPHCGRVLGWRDLVPVVSWVANRARCAYCKARISSFYPAIELGALAVAAWSLALPGALAWAGSIFGWILLALAAIDLRSYRLPHHMTVPLAIAGLVVSGLIAPARILDALLGAALGFALFALVAWAYHRLRGCEGLGEGDAWLLAAIGAWVGWQGIPSVILLACLSGFAWVGVRLALGKAVSGTTPLAFGPHLCLAGWIIWLYGPLQLG